MQLGGISLAGTRGEKLDVSEGRTSGCTRHRNGTFAGATVDAADEEAR